MEKIIDCAINQMLVEVQMQYGLTSGDIAPLDDMIIDDIKEQLLEVLERFKNLNTCTE
jgi:hypothetical protein